MVVDKGSTVSSPVSVAERIAALQKGQDDRNACKSSTAHKLPTARPLTISKESNALTDLIALFQNTADKAGDSRSDLNSIPVRTKPSNSIHTTTDRDRSYGMTADITTKSSSTFTKTNQTSHDQPPVKPNIISSASQISVLQQTIGARSGSCSTHPSRNVTTSIQSSTDSTATLPPRPPVLQNTKEVQSIADPDHLSPMQELALGGKAAADDVTNCCSSLNQKILKDSEVQVRPLKQTRQAPTLKDISNRMRNKIDAKKSANLQSLRNNKLNQEAYNRQKIEHGVRKEKENTQVESQIIYEDVKSSTGVSDIDSDMITLPASNKNAKLDDSSFGTSDSWNNQKTINGWQGFYQNFDLPTPSMLLESQISTPVTKNTRRKNKYNNSKDDTVASMSNMHNAINPPRRDGMRKKVGNTDESQDDSDMDGCLLMEEIWSIFTSLSSAVR